MTRESSSEQYWDTYGELPAAPSMPYPTPEEFLQGVKRWQKQWPERIKLERWGRSQHGWPLTMVAITDRTVSANDKQVLLLSSSHGYMTDEVGVLCGLLHFMKWFLSDDPAAARLRRRIIVICMPVIGEMYLRWKWDGPDPKRATPDSEAFFAMMEKYQPDAHMDIHGLGWRDLGMQESIGISTPRMNRCFDPETAEAVARAVDKAGYCAIRSEVQAGRLCVATAKGELKKAVGAFAAFDAVPEQFQRYRLAVNPTTLSFLRYHAVSFNTEQFWMGSIAAGCRSMAEIGLQRKFWNFYPGYPNNLVQCHCQLMVAAWGDTAAKRRKSRVELWNRAGLACVNGAPTILRDKMMAVVATTAAGARLVGNRGLEPCLNRISKDSRFDSTPIVEFLKDYPTTLGQQSLKPGTGLKRWHNAPPVRNGLALRLCLQYKDARLKELRLNGHRLKRSAIDGYQVHHRQGTVVQVNIPPGKVHDLHFVTVRYDSRQRPDQGFTPEDWLGEHLRVGTGKWKECSYER